VIQGSTIYGHYEKAVDRESAYEKLRNRAEQKGAQVPETPAGKASAASGQSEAGRLVSAMAKSAAHAIGSQIGRQIIRGVLGSLLGGKRR